MKFTKSIERQIEAPLPECCPSCGQKPGGGRDAQVWNATMRADGIVLRALGKRKERFFVPWRDVLNAALKRGIFVEKHELEAAAAAAGGRP